MILVMVVLGGATRLTGSGLSIMEWAPIMGALPPLSEAEWNRLFALYQQIPQYALVNDGFGLEGFKHIFWLEWSHRLWGRLIGLVFLVPLVWFAATGRIERRFIPRLVLFFVLGGLQGAVGWFMVSSGFFPDATAVAPVRLVLHLGLALLLYSTVLWTALTMLPPGPGLRPAGLMVRGLAWLTLAQTALTIVAGGFVAGLHAGLVYNTFPLMDGHLAPEGYATLRPLARNLVENVPAVQFDHRVIASLTLLSVCSLTAMAWPYRSVLGWRIVAPAAAAGLQYGLGVATLLLAVPVGLAVLHQFCATLLLTAVLIVLHAVAGPSRRDHHGQTAHETPFQGSVRNSSAAHGNEEVNP